MITAYINYPVPHIKVHNNPAQFQKHNKRKQRIVTIDENSLTHELSKFNSKEYRFASTGEFNDMWLIIDLKNQSTEIEVLNKIQQAIGKHYKPLSPNRVAIEFSNI